MVTPLGKDEEPIKSSHPKPSPSAGMEDEAPHNLVGLLESDPELAGAINEILPRKRGGVRRLIAELGRAVANQDYQKAGDILAQIQAQYGNSFEDIAESTLGEHIPPGIFDQIPKPTPEPSAGME